MEEVDHENQNNNNDREVKPLQPKMLTTLNKRKHQPGYRFAPTDEELVVFFLKRKVKGKNLHGNEVATVDVYKHAPWDLPIMAGVKSSEQIWYFFTPKRVNNPNAKRDKRVTPWGNWKKTGTDRIIVTSSHRANVRKVATLVFYGRRRGTSERTDWVMHEYKLRDERLHQRNIQQDSYVLCKLYKKSGFGPKTADQYGAPFLEEEWDTDTDEDIKEQEDNDNFAILAKSYCMYSGQ
ncbi:NAC domain-containing protein 16-like [Spinacia oleracea]|uniref:NAC domain-containing protein 16-like n=1 Tax=Spinacia oleracea TaxID=3562 RepID=A0ABM3QYZ5_SPIOL|nr:NAC domain-containing protein 16-like [Spinacia oleracea]